MIKKIEKSDSEWKALLSPEQYAICRKKGTERAFTGRYHDFKGQGVYHCVCCDGMLFSSAGKYDSGSGWPSFTAPVKKEAIAEKRDRSIPFMPRTEVLCAACDAHLGHVFADGPAPTGLRYCINSAALRFEEEENKENNS